INPVQELAGRGAEAIFNLSASPFDKSKHRTRVEMIHENIERTGLPVFYANQVGGNADLISDGDSMVVDANKNIIARAPLFKEAAVDVEWIGGKLNTVRGGIKQITSRLKRIFKALCYGLQEYLKKSGAGKKVIIGLSGGIDSALAACIAVEALGPKNVKCVIMPSPYSSRQSADDAKKLADNLSINPEEIAINAIYEAHLNALKPLFKNSSFGTTQENLQARIRGVLLMAISNEQGGLVLNTENKSEVAVGYSTLYGDTIGALSVIGDLYKTEVYKLAHWLNEDYYRKEIIPRSILEKAPSAELSPGQKDADTLPSYDILDAILKLYIEERCSEDEITEKGFEEKVVRRIVQLIHQSEYKRRQIPPALKISYTSFGTGLRWPINSDLQL
ncbi:MAG TPA: NAD+ synthase, partial [Balneolaceae bacterium]|nr:NAD+ synthase [Balneolaceae bacterium]